ncbi:MAG: gamma-glutamyltransferase family protein, partial [Phycisphaerae bacterium]|nr:gamma-glutamyltransferase family protein [Phycisphaerae bacterium]
ECGHRQATSTGGMVVTAFPSASGAGVEMLRAGGNAIDAAAAAAWALAVCEPSGSGLGGQTTMLICFADSRTLVVDGYSRAPAAVSRRLVSARQQQKGYRACTIPSTPATLEFAQKRYGVLASAKVMEPAIRLAEDGYAITKLQRRQLNWCMADLLASGATARLFLKKGRPFQVGDVFRQKELAATLRRLADLGVEDFYQGKIARTIAKDMTRNGGLITEKDLADYKGPIERDALAAAYRNYQVAGVPPPGGGLQVLLGLKIIEHLASEDLMSDPDRWYELLAEVTYAVFRERDRFVVHPRDLTPSLMKWLLSDERVSEIAGHIRTGFGESSGETGGEESGETTHLCTVDGSGNAVALTQSIQSLFGAKVANGQLGFLYNNYLCTCKRRRHPYRLGSGCIPQSNIAPTFVWRNGLYGKAGEQVDAGITGPLLVLGAAGSRRITSAILHVISGVVDRGLSLEEAVSLPRVHGLRSRKVHIERPAATEPLLRRLEKRFQKVIIKAPHSYSMGAVQAIRFANDRTLVGMADPRRDGSAVGL